jgi:hypothetical protein
VSVTAAPAVTVAGSTIAAAAPGARPGLLAVDSLTVSWGRAGLLEQPTPARASLTVLDTTPGRTFAASALIGQPVLIGWTGSDGATGTTFRGRVTDAAVRRYVTRDGSVSGALVELNASSIEVDLANYVVPAGTTAWTTESFSARLARILALLPAGLLTGATLDPGWAGYVAGQLDPSGNDALSLLRRLYDSTARPLVYDPAANALTYGRRRFVPAGAAGGNQNFSAALVQSGGGLWAADCSPVGGSWLDAHTLQYAGAVTSTLQQLVTRVEVGWINGTATATAAAAVWQGLDESALGRRVLSIESMHSGSAAAADCVTEWASLVSGEGAMPHLEPLSYSTGRTPFRDAATRAALLAGCEQPTWWFLRRSWLPDIGVPPLYGFIGGTVAYSDGQWSLALQPAPAQNANTTPGLRVRFAAADTSVRLVDLDDSLTLADCDHVQVGAGYTTATMPLN